MQTSNALGLIVYCQPEELLRFFMVDADHALLTPALVHQPGLFLVAYQCRLVRGTTTLEARLQAVLVLAGADELSREAVRVV